MLPGPTPSSTTAEGCPCRVSLVWKTTEDGEVLVLTARRLIRLNPTAAMIWHLADGKTPVSAIIGTLSARFSTVDRSQVKADVNELLELAEAEGILVRQWDPF